MKLSTLNLRLLAAFFIVAGIGIASFLIRTEVGNPPSKPFHLGLDLSGGSYLVYSADTSGLSEENIKDSMAASRDVMERRLNLFGVSEPKVTTETSNLSDGGSEHRLVIELPGVTDIDEAIEQIGQTPLLEFKTENPDFDRQALEDAFLKFQETQDQSALQNIEFNQWLDTELSGKQLKRASVQFQQGFGAPSGSVVVQLIFDKEGADLFEKITEENIGKPVAIFLDGAPISTPTVQAKISGGEAVITGNFDIDEAKQLAGRLNSGALPVPIELLSTQTIGPSLGHGASEAGVRAGVFGFILIALFLIMWYRLPGLLATISLGIYAAIVLAFFKLIPVTLTTAGIAGFIISLGIAVDANILIFERMKEELAMGRSIYDSVKEGFSRAWSSIRDANISSLISAIILFWFGTSLIQGFALTFGIGILVSMFSAITVTRVMLLSLGGKNSSNLLHRLYRSGINWKKLI